MFSRCVLSSLARPRNLSEPKLENCFSDESSSCLGIRVALSHDGTVAQYPAELPVN